MIRIESEYLSDLHNLRFIRNNIILHERLLNITLLAYAANHSKFRKVLLSQGILLELLRCK